MKVRTDFVSNSSSSSFICAVNGTYDLPSLAKDIAKGCSNPKAKWHDPELKVFNAATVEHCLENYCLLFLGQLKIGTLEFKRSKVEQHERIKARFSDLDEAALEEKIESSWNEILKQAKLENEVAKLGQKPATIDEKAEAVTFYDNEYVGGLAVSKSQIWHMVSHHTEAEMPAELERYAKWWHENQDDLDFIDTYSVTEDTLRHTRLMLKAGMPLELDGWEKDLDGLEKRLAEGEKLFALRVMYDGDCKDATTVYKEDGAPGIDNLAIEVLHSEAL